MIANKSYPLTVAVIGRPNVGKSSLINRIIGKKLAVVQNEPNATRDRVTYNTDWSGVAFDILDTGGWVSVAKDLQSQVVRQSEKGIEIADLILFLTDAKVGIQDEDLKLVKLLRKSGKPVVVVVNKADDFNLEQEASEFWSLGLKEVVTVSALHGLGIGDLLDLVVQKLKETNKYISNPLIGKVNTFEQEKQDFQDEEEFDWEKEGIIPKIAIIGRPNVGKSSLLNKLTGQDRAIVSDKAGTTRDPISQVISFKNSNTKWEIIDTAGIKRKLYKVQGADFYSNLRTQGAIEEASVVVLMIDGFEQLSEQDIRVANTAIEAGKALVIAINKLDILDSYRKLQLKRELDLDLKPYPWVLIVRLSALTGKNIAKLEPALRLAFTSWNKRVSTRKLNLYIRQVNQTNPHPARAGKQPKILYATQANICPPQIVLSTTGNMEENYKRFLARKIREEYGFESSPIQIHIRPRNTKI